MWWYETARRRAARAALRRLRASRARKYSAGMAAMPSAAAGSRIARSAVPKRPTIALTISVFSRWLFELV